MLQPNLERMIQLATDVFDVKNDPDQLNVNPEIIERLRQMHPSTLSEMSDENGPYAWVLIIPTTHELMNKFLRKEINERELFDLTPTDADFEALYLCSALVLEEYRRKGITKQLAVTAIENIRKVHPIKSLFVWAFSKEGDLASETIAKEVGLPLFKRDNDKF